MSEFQVRRSQFTEARVQPTEAAGLLGNGEIRARIERFAFTANNITYAVAGDLLRYWQFFPPRGPETPGWGVIPVWGFAEVSESRCPEVAVGERLFGYFPPADSVTLLPARISTQRFFDASPHRAELPAGYNSYSRVANEAGYDTANDALRMLLWPLYITAFCIWDQLKEQNWYGAEQVLILSASSKTSLGLGYALQTDPEAPPSIGLTSARNQAFVDGTGLYDGSARYDTLDAIESRPTVIVDMAGNQALIQQLRQQLGAQMKYCIHVGMTHWDNAQGAPTHAADSEFFFAPARLQKRMKDWGADGFSRKTGAFMAGGARQSRHWLSLQTLDGLAALAQVYPDVCQGRVPPEQGLIVQM